MIDREEVERALRIAEIVGGDGCWNGTEVEDICRALLECYDVLALVSRVPHVTERGYVLGCPVCHSYNAHLPDCRLAAVLARTRGSTKTHKEE